MFVEIDDDSALGLLPSVQPKGFASPSAAPPALISPAMSAASGGAGRRSPRFPDSPASMRSPRSRTLGGPRALGLNLRRIRPAAAAGRGDPPADAVVAGNNNNNHDGTSTAAATGRHSIGAHTAATPVMRGGRKGGGAGAVAAAQVASPSPSPRRGGRRGDDRQKMEDEYYRPTMLWEEEDDDDEDEDTWDEDDDDGGEDGVEVLDDGELPSLRRAGSGESRGKGGRAFPGFRSKKSRVKPRILEGRGSSAVGSSPPPLIAPSAAAAAAAGRAAQVAPALVVTQEQLKVAGFWSQLDVDDVDEAPTYDDDGDDDDDEGEEEMPMDERRNFSRSPGRRSRGGPPPLAARRREKDDDDDDDDADGKWAEAVGMDVVARVEDEDDDDDDNGRMKTGGGSNKGGVPYLLSKAACYANDNAAAESVDEGDGGRKGNRKGKDDDGSIIGTYTGTIATESDDDQSLDRTFQAAEKRAGETTVNEDDDDGGNPLLRCINDALLTVCGFGVDNAPARATTTTTTTMNAKDDVSPAKRRALEIVNRNRLTAAAAAAGVAAVVVSDGEDSLGDDDKYRVVGSPDGGDSVTIEEDTAIELQYHATDGAAWGDEKTAAFRLPMMPGLISPKSPRGSERDKKKDKRTGLKKFLNQFSPKKRRQHDDDDDDGEPRKTLVTATTRSENGQEPSQRPKTKLTDMYSSLTFEQEILGEGDDDGGDDRPEKEPVADDHDDEGDHRESPQGERAAATAAGGTSAASGISAAARADLYEDEEELESEAAAWSTNKKNSYLRKLAERAKMDYAAKAATVGVLAERANMEYASRAGADGSAGEDDGRADAAASMPMLLLTTADGEDGSSSYNADYNSFSPAQKRLFLRLLNSGLSPKDAALRISQERDRPVVDADDDATEQDDGYAADNRLRSPGYPDDEDDQPLMFVDPPVDISRGALGESAELLVKIEERDQSDDSDGLPVVSAADISESEMAQEEGKSSYQGRYGMLAAIPLVPAIVRAKSRSKSKERYQMHSQQEYEEGAGQFQRAPAPDIDGLPPSGISYYDAYSRGIDPNDGNYDESGLLDSNITSPRGRSRKSKLLGAAFAAKVVPNRQGGLGKRDIRYKNVNASSALPLTMAEDDYSAAPMNYADNDGGAKSDFNLMSPKSLSSALNFMSRRPNSKRFSKLDSDLDLDQVAPSRSVEVEGMPSWLLPRDNDDNDHDDNNDHDNEDNVVEGEEDEDELEEREDEFEDEDEVEEGEEEEDELEEEEDGEYGSEGEESMEDEYVSESEGDIEPNSTPSPPPEATWVSPEMHQTRKTNDIISSYNNTPGNHDILSPQDSLMFSPDSLEAMYSPANSPSDMVDTGKALQRDAKYMPAMASSLASNPEEDIASSMDQSTMAGSTLTSASRPHRKRHKGAASKRLMQAKQAEDRFGSPKRNGWFDSIRDAASTQGQVWDPVLGWVNYSEPEVHGVVDHDYSSIGSLHLTLPHKIAQATGEPDNASYKRMATDLPEKWAQERATVIAGSRGVVIKSSADTTLTTDDDDTVFDSMTVNTVNTAAESYSVNGTSQSAPKRRAVPRHRTTDRRLIASAHQDKKPVGWKESMENATAHVVNYDGTGRHWDYKKGWIRADGTVDDDISVLTRSTLDGVQQMDPGRNGIIPVTESNLLPPVVEEVIDDAYSTAEEANMNTKGMEHIDDYSDGNDIGEIVDDYSEGDNGDEELNGSHKPIDPNGDIADTIQPQGSDKENQESKKEASSVTKQLQYSDQRPPVPVPNKNNNKRSLNQWLEKANKNAPPKHDESEGAAIISNDTRESSSSDMFNNNSKASKTQSQPTPFHYANFPDSFGEIELGVQEVKVVKEKFSDADSDLFEPSKIDVSQSFINMINRANFDSSQRLALKKSESHDSNSTGLPPPPPQLPHSSSLTKDQSRSTVVLEKSLEGTSGAGPDGPRWLSSMDKMNRQQQLPVGEEKSLASELDSNVPQVNKTGGAISSISNATTDASNSYIGTRNAKKAADSWIQSRKDPEKKGEVEVEQSQAPPYDKPIENTTMSNIVGLRAKFESYESKSAPIFVATNNRTAENQVFFRSAAMGIRLKRGEDGFVRVVSVTEATAGSSIVRDGVIEPEDAVVEAAGVDLRMPITNSQWGETVTKIRNAPRPMLFVVAAGPNRKVEEKPEYQQSQSRILPPPAKYVMESRLSKSPEGQEVLETLSVARSYERVLESLSMKRERSPVLAPPAVKITNNTSSQTSVEEADTTVGEEDQTASRNEEDHEPPHNQRKESLLKRIASGCAAPVIACNVPSNQSSQQSSSQLNSEDENHVPMAHLQFLRTNPTIARVTNAASRRYPALCGRPDTIFEEPSDDDTRETRSYRMKERSSRKDLRQSSSRSSASTNDDGSHTLTTTTSYDAKTAGANTAGSVGSSSGGDNTAFLEKLAIQSTVASKPTRPQRGEGNKNLSQAQKLSKATYGLSQHLITGSQYEQQGGELEWPDDDDQQRPQLFSEGTINDAPRYSNRKKMDPARQVELLAAAKVEDMVNELQDVDPEDQCEI